MALIFLIVFLFVRIGIKFCKLCFEVLLTFFVRFFVLTTRVWSRTGIKLQKSGEPRDEAYDFSFLNKILY